QQGLRRDCPFPGSALRECPAVHHGCAAAGGGDPAGGGRHGLAHLRGPRGRRERHPDEERHPHAHRHRQHALENGLTRHQTMETLPAFALALLALAAFLVVTGTPALGQDSAVRPTMGKIVREDPGLDRLLDPHAPIEVLGSGFDWTEGPVWMKEGGYLLFSDIPAN